MSARVFDCKLYNVQALKLPQEHQADCNPFIKLEVCKKTIVLPKKKKTLNPEWPEFTGRFKIDVVGSLRDHDLVLTVMIGKAGRKPEKLGRVKVDLHTIATGPVEHRLKIRSEEVSEDIGTLKFKFRMKEKRKVTLQFSNLKIVDVKHHLQKPKLLLSLNTISEKVKSVMSDVKKGTMMPVWKRMKPLVYQPISLKAVVADIVFIHLCRKKFIGRDKVGVAVFEIKKHIKSKPEGPIPLKLEMKHPVVGDVIASLECEVEFFEMAEYAQMTSGEHTDFACNGDVLLKGFEEPEPPVLESFDQPKEIKTFITVDLGTTHSGYSYCTADVKDIDKVNIHMSWGEGNYKYKNKSSILYNDYEPVAWGFRAISQYNAKRKKERKKDSHEEFSKWTLISDFKLNIHLNEDIDMNGRTFGITKVCGDFLMLIKDDIIAELTKQGYNTERRFCKWVLTVPAIWSDSDKSIMRDAAFQSGIIDDDCDDDDHFSFALEPESASLPCLLYDRADIKPKTRFLVLDAGGGTIDIAVYETVKPPDGTKFGIRQLQNASGGASGGKFINDRFLLFLKQNIPSKAYKKIVNSYDFNELMTRWEESKLQFKKENIDDDIFISLPASINSIVADIEELEDYYEEDEGDLIIPGELFYEIYRAPIDRTVEYVREEIEKMVKPISFIFMVGGFSESQILYDAIRDNFESPQLKVIKTSQPGIRVLQGAAWFGKYPKIISSRCSQLTYIAKIARERIPPGKKKAENELYFTEGGLRMDKPYKIMARAGDILDAGSKVKLECELNGDRGIVDVFATNRPRIKKIAPPECEKLLSIALKLKKKRKKARLDVYVVFGSTELKFEIIDPKTGKRIKSNMKVTYDKGEILKQQRGRGGESSKKLMEMDGKKKYKPKRRKKR